MKLSLNGAWAVRTDAEENGLAQNWASRPIEAEGEVMVPGCIQQLDSLAEKYPSNNDRRNGYLGTFFMEKNVSLPELKKGERCRLYIGGVIPSCHIWVNGSYALKHILGLNRIYLDITEYVTAGENRITLAVTEQYASLITGMRFMDMNWSGIYSEAYVEISGALQFQNAYISLKDGEARLCFLAVNDGDTDVETELQAVLGEGDTLDNIAPGQMTSKEIISRQASVTERLAVPAGSSKEISLPVKVDGLPRWSYRSPRMISVSMECEDSDGNICGCRFRTGLREITIDKERILVDGNPTFFAGTGSEYYSPTIAPLTDKDIIRRRYEALQAYGFNFYRCHTHIPTEEELCVADEMGIMLCVEFGLVSNFHKTTPVEKGMEMLGIFVEQTRRHPSLFVYCLGNEGSQLMVDSYIERNKAKMGYRIIKEHTDNQLAIIAFGMQGELPELPNDFETPHLWSENFLWAYDGLTDIPWEDLGRTTGGKPCIIHEYGKFGVWPSREEERDCTVPGGIKPDHGTQSHQWLVENGLEHLEERLIANSRASASSFNRIILEDSRRQPYCSGYALWTFFRRSGCNAGLSDDLGIHLNGDPAAYKNGVNGDVAVLMDRGFLNRAFPCEVAQTIGLSLSNFGLEPLKGTIIANVVCDGENLAGMETEASAAVGETRKVTDFVFRIPAAWSGKKLTLSAIFTAKSGVTVQNQWVLWAFDASADSGVRAYLHVEDLTTFRAIKRIFPMAQRLSSVDSVIIGCRSWRNPRLAETAGARKEVLIISDVYDDVVKACIENGNKVLLLDSGQLPDEWMLPPICAELGERDTGRFFTSFRAGWDKGNLVTLVNEDALLGEFPQEGYCGLQFYDMVQSARIMKPEVLEAVWGRKPKRIIFSISKLPPETKAESVVQDPNAIKEQETSAKKRFSAREQGYFLKVHDRLAVCTLKLTDNPAGLALLKETVRHF